MNFVVAGNRPWSRAAFLARSPRLPGNWHLIEKAQDLTSEALSKSRPRYVFFPHWSWKVPDDIVTMYECVCFHMTDVPYGRGGSPLQNLIVRGHKESKLTALRMVSEMDAGPVYLKRPLSLEGRAEDIFYRAADLAWDMIEEIVATTPVPHPQVGDPTIFKRRTPVESELPVDGNLARLFDFVRMLDAETYPKAFLEVGDLRMEFDRATLDDGAMTARVVFTQKEAAVKND